MKRAVAVGIGALLLLASWAVANVARVPDVVGDSYLEGGDSLRSAGFDVAADSDGSRGPHDLELIDSQSPAAGSLRAAGTTVILGTRPPKPRSTVPDVSGLSISDAVDAVHEAGLWPETGGWVPDGIVTSTFPAAGTDLRFGAPVGFVIDESR